MTRIRILVLAAVVCVAAACGKPPEPQAPATPAPESAPPAPVAAPAPVTEAPAAPQAAPVEESAGTETVAPADKNPLGKEIVLPSSPASAAASAPAKTDWQYAEGDYYNTLPAAQGTSSPTGKIEVAEVFWYGCGHCYNLEPLISDWEKKLPSDVNLVRIPVMWNPTNEIHGRVHYTAEALGKGDVIRPAMFRAIHVDNEPMTEEKEIQKLFEENGISAADFNRTFRSFSVESQLKRAKDLTVKYRVRGVPLLVVNGKYTTDGQQIKSHQELLAVTEELIQRERQRD
ncbi:MAG: thiol:disulfide interchange protein DsbA/DsbL [Gammaproteobacteria bacterium]|nr:thiol:disulfide interchange protein DsbA/DsbL [Gammaproteobacteria bacterium]